MAGRCSYDDPTLVEECVRDNTGYDTTQVTSQGSPPAGASQGSEGANIECLNALSPDTKLHND